MSSRTSRGLARLPIMALVLACQQAPTELPPEPRLLLNPRLLVSTEWLARNGLQSPSVVVLHVGTRANYDAGHVPGARFVELAPLQPTRDGIPLVLADAAVLRDAFEAAGVDRSSHVVVYGDGLLQGARGFFMLDYLGHPDVSLLDGGKAAWTAEGRALSTEPVSPARGSLPPTGTLDRLVLAEWVQGRLQDPGTVLIDARPTADYAGTVAASALVPRPGHIPGAYNIFWQQLVVATNVPRLQETGLLAAFFAGTGAGPRTTMVAYCFSGMMSSVAYFVGRYLGYDIRLYDGSFYDWSPRTTSPVATCASPHC